jgi:hypothetical protein
MVWDFEDNRSDIAFLRHGQNFFNHRKVARGVVTRCLAEQFGREFRKASPRCGVANESAARKIECQSRVSVSPHHLVKRLACRLWRWVCIGEPALGA